MSSSSAALVKSFEQQARAHAGVLLLFSTVVLAILFCVAVVARGMWLEITRWRVVRQTDGYQRRRGVDDAPEAEDDVPDADDDDVVDRPPAAEVLRQRMAALERRYDRYNRALQTHLADRDSALAAAPDGRMDARAMAGGKDDDWDYARGRDT